MMQDGKKLTNYAVEYGSSLNCDYIEARFLNSRKEGYTTRNGVLLGGGVNTSSGIGVRILHQGNIAFTSTAKLTKDSIKKIVDIAKSMTSVSTRKKPIQFSSESSVQTKWETPVETSFDDVSIEDKQQFLTDIDKGLVEKFGADLPNRTITLSLSNEFKYIANSEGSQVESMKYQPIINTFNTAVGNNGTEQRSYSRGGTGGWEWFAKDNITERIMSDAFALVKSAKNAESMDLGKMDVIVSSEVAGIMAHENVGHPSEADRIFGRCTSWRVVLYRFN